MAASGLISRSDLVGTGRAIFVLFGINGIRNKRSHLIVSPFLVFKARFSAIAGWHFSRDLCRCLLIGGCGQSQYPLESGNDLEKKTRTLKSYVNNQCLLYVAKYDVLKKILTNLCWLKRF